MIKCGLNYEFLHSHDINWILGWFDIYIYVHYTYNISNECILLTGKLINFTIHYSNNLKFRLNFILHANNIKQRLFSNNNTSLRKRIKRINIYILINLLYCIYILDGFSQDTILNYVPSIQCKSNYNTI